MTKNLFTKVYTLGKPQNLNRSAKPLKQAEIPEVFRRRKKQKVYFSSPTHNDLMLLLERLFLFQLLLSSLKFRLYALVGEDSELDQ